MRFFDTAEAFHTVSRKLMANQRIISNKLIPYLTDKDYGEGILDWAYISIVVPPAMNKAGFAEIKRYSKPKKSLDVRLYIDYETMLKADDKGVLKLICDTILKSVDVAEHELKIKDFDYRSFRNDLITLFEREGWL